MFFIVLLLSARDVAAPTCRLLLLVITFWQSTETADTTVPLFSLCQTLFTTKLHLTTAPTVMTCILKILRQVRFVYVGMCHIVTLMIQKVYKAAVYKATSTLKRQPHMKNDCCTACFTLQAMVCHYAMSVNGKRLALASLMNSFLLDDATIWQPGFDLPQCHWSIIYLLWTNQLQDGSVVWWLRYWTYDLMVASLINGRRG